MSWLILIFLVFSSAGYGPLEKKEKELLQKLELTPNNAKLLFSLSEIYFQMGYRRLALNYLMQAIENSSDKGLVRDAIFLLLKNHEIKKAIELAKKHKIKGLEFLFTPYYFLKSTSVVRYQKSKLGWKSYTYTQFLTFNNYSQLWLTFGYSLQSYRNLPFNQGNFSLFFAGYQPLERLYLNYGFMKLKFNGKSYIAFSGDLTFWFAKKPFGTDIRVISAENNLRCGFLPFSWLYYRGFYFRVMIGFVKNLKKSNDWHMTLKVNSRYSKLPIFLGLSLSKGHEPLFVEPDEFLLLSDLYTFRKRLSTYLKLKIQDFELYSGYELIFFENDRWPALWAGLSFKI